MDPIAVLIADLAKWRETEQAAMQDIEDADAHVIAMDMRFQEARRRALCVSNRVKQIQIALLDAINDHTAPCACVYLPDGSR